MRFRLRRRWLALLLGIGVAVVVVVAAAIYLFDRSPIARVTILGGTLTLEEGADARGWWLGPPQHNYTGTGSGFPIVVAPGSAFSIAVPLLNSDDRNHTLDSITAEAPFAVAGTSVPFPALVPTGLDSDLLVTIDAPPTAGSYHFLVTIISS